MTAKAATDPPVAQTAIEILQAELLQWKTETIELRAYRDARDKADAEALARELDENNPARNFQRLMTGCADVGYDTDSQYKKVWRWCDRKTIYAIKPDGIHYWPCLNDLRDKVNKTGRHR
jgi:hypothetical protein